QIGSLHGLASPADAFLFDGIGAVTQTGRVQDMQGQAIDVDVLAQYVAGGAGDVGDDGGILTGERIQQRRLAGVRFTHDGDLDAFTHEVANTGLREGGSEAFVDVLQLAGDSTVGEEVDFLLGEVQGGFHVDAQQDQCFYEIIDATGEFALQGTQGITRSGDRGTVDQVGDGFRLGEVDLVVEKGAPGKLAGFGEAGAVLDQCVQNQLGDDGAAVAMQLGNIFTGEGADRKSVV